MDVKCYFSQPQCMGLGIQPCPLLPYLSKLTAVLSNLFFTHETTDSWIDA